MMLCSSCFTGFSVTLLHNVIVGECRAGDKVNK